LIEGVPVVSPIYKLGHLFGEVGPTHNSYPQFKKTGRGPHLVIHYPPENQHGLESAPFPIGFIHFIHLSNLVHVMMSDSASEQCTIGGTYCRHLAFWPQKETHFEAGKLVKKPSKQKKNMRKTLELELLVELEKKLAGGFNPFEKYYSNWESSPSRDKNKTYLKPPPRKSVENFW